MGLMLWRQDRAKAEAAHGGSGALGSQDGRDLSQTSSLEKQLAPGSLRAMGILVQGVSVTHLTHIRAC